MARSDEIRKWLGQDYSRWSKLRRVMAAFYHNRVPRKLKFRLAGFLHWLTKAILACSAPILALWYGSISSFWIAGVAVAGLLSLHVIVSFFDRLSPSDQKDNQAETFVRVGDLLSLFRSSPIKASHRSEAIRACLGILENMALPITKSVKGEISVSLLVYVGSSATRMRISERNPGNTRPTNREVDGDMLLGHHCCSHDALPRVVDDIRQFGKGVAKSPTQAKLSYRSIFIIPLDPDPAKGRKAKGFISIDCARPYAFYGNRSNEIIVTSEPIKALISELI